MRNKLSLLFIYIFRNILSVTTHVWTGLKQRGGAPGGEKKSGGELLPPRKSPPIRFHRRASLLRPPPSCSLSLGTTFRQKNSRRWRLNRNVCLNVRSARTWLGETRNGLNGARNQVQKLNVAQKGWRNRALGIL